MRNFPYWWRNYWVILLFVCINLVLHIISSSNYGLHRDAYLYLAQAKNLDWGYYSTPPLTAFLTRIHTIIWGNSVWAVRLLPTFIGSLSMFLVGWLIIQLKGGRIAQCIGMTAYLMSPAFLRPASLLQPVVINHLFWLLSAIVVFIIIRKQHSKYLLLLIPVLGLGWLNKYSIVFYGIALLFGLIISRHRKILWSHYLVWTIVGALIIIFPNILWQFNHHWPVFHHMSELQQSQFVNVNLVDFLFSQIFMHFPALLVWIAGLIFLIFSREHRPYRIFAWAFFITLLMIILLNGKFYYTIAAYTILVVFGAIAWEKLVQKTHAIIAILVIAIIFSTGIFILPFSLPILKPERMVQYDKKMMEKGLGVMLNWEDGKVHDLPQDYADMVGWDQLGEKVWNFYESLEDSVKVSTLVYGENYGMAGSILYYRPKESYPEVFSFNDAFMEWAPRYFRVNHFIYVGYSDQLHLYFNKLEFVGEVDDPYFRENGLPIFFGSYPTKKLYEDWEETWLNSSGKFLRMRSKVSLTP